MRRVEFGITEIVIGVEQEPRVQFTLPCGPDGPPTLILLPDGTHIVKVGRYASPGDHYCYQRVDAPARLPASVVVSPWVKYSGLKGSGEPAPIAYEALEEKPASARRFIVVECAENPDPQRFGPTPAGYRCFRVTCTDTEPPIDTFIHALNLDRAKATIRSMIDGATFSDEQDQLR